ncbi:MAG: lipocalin-like domain-containing protein [Nitrospirota bacterium]
MTTIRAFILLFSLIGIVPDALPQEFSEVTAESRLQFPRDLYHNSAYRVQWWYFTGHLFDAGGREFGYELTFFVVGVQKRDYSSQFGVSTIYISHFAVSDIQDRKFLFHERADAGAYGFAGARSDRLHVWVGASSLEGSMEKMQLKASGERHALELTLTPLKPLVLHGEQGYSRKSRASPLIASYYFSYPRLAAEGTLRIGSATFTVSGTSWFDRELSSRGLDAGKAGWDWFSLQLDDGRDVMLYLIRNRDGSHDPYSSGTLVYPDGSYRHLAKKEFTIKTLRHYTSEKTGARYPAQWEIALPAERLALTVTPLIEDQEVLSTKTTRNYYWEGACTVTGNATGRAYVELVGY